jgi:hypothetical protein
MKRRATLTGGVVAFALVLAACGGGSGGDAAVSIKTLQAAVSNTQAAQSSRFKLDVSVNAAGRDVSIRGSGMTTADNKTGQFTFEIPMLGSIEARIVDGSIYMNLGSLGALSGKLPEGKQWISVSFDELRKRTGTDLSQLFEQAQSNGPQQGLQYLQGLSGDVVKVGDDTIAGAHATHYRASIDYAKAAAKLPDSASEMAGKLAKLGRCRPTCGSTTTTVSSRCTSASTAAPSGEARERPTSRWRSPTSVCPSTSKHHPQIRPSTSPRSWATGASRSEAPAPNAA